ncbi:hypothetical protein D3C81_456660 [compost metagenome]
MHVDQHQALGVLRQYIDAVQLGQGKAQRILFARHGFGRGDIRFHLRDRRTGRAAAAEQGAIRGRVLGHARCIGKEGPRRAGGGGGVGVCKLRAERRLRLFAAPDAGSTQTRTGGIAAQGGGGRQGRRYAAEGRGRGLRQRALHRVENELVHGAAVAEAHFDLRRVHVDVDQGRVEVERQHVRWKTVAMQHVLVGHAHGVHQQLVAHEAPVHIEELAVGAGLGGRWQAGKAVQAQAAGRFVQRQACFGEVVAEDVRAAPGQFADIPLVDGAAVVRQRKRHVRPRQRDAAHDFGAVAVFRLLGFEEFAPRRRIEIQVLHVHRGAVRARRRRDAAVVRADDFPRMGRVHRARGQRNGGHRRDGGQRLATETQGADVFQVVQGSDFRGGMARQGQRQLFLVDAASVVGDGDAFHAAFFQAHRDLRGARVERVFQQLLDHGRRPLDHLAGGDLRNQLVRQGLDRAAGRDGSVHPQIIAGSQGEALLC